MFFIIICAKYRNINFSAKRAKVSMKANAGVGVCCFVRQRANLYESEQTDGYHTIR